MENMHVGLEQVGVYYRGGALLNVSRASFRAYHSKLESKMGILAIADHE
jgi:hypothetical protein